MQYLLDTHAILWYLFGDSRLSENARKIIETNDCYFSYASFWEISIKQSKKKLEFTPNINVKHNDPFDRMLTSQAMNNNMTIITCDEKIPLYNVKTVW